MGPAAATLAQASKLTPRASLCSIADVSHRRSSLKEQRL
jgi:hypothetical protein